MNKSLRPVKLLPVWIAVSSVIIIAGIILMALLGFNYSAEKPECKTFEVSYDIFITASEDSEKALKDACESAFADNGLSYSDCTVQDDPQMEGSEKIVYTFSANASDESLAKAKAAVETYVAEAYPDVENIVQADYHTVEYHSFHEADWRGAVGLAVGAIVALIYVGVRFGVSSALTGLIACVHDGLLTLSLFAITRIPVYTASPLFLAGVAVVCSLILWIVQCARMREAFKDPAAVSEDVAHTVEESCLASWKIIVIIASALASVVVITGLVATASVRLLVLPAVIAVAAGIYSSLLLAPAVHAPMRKSFSRFTVTKKRYIGKKKAEEEAAE